MKGPRIRWTLALGGEILLAIGLCVVSYGLFLSLLGVIFPSSTGLHDLILATGRTRSASDAARAHVLRGSGSVGDVTEAPALLRVLNPRVMRKQADAVAWVPAGNGTKLHGRDGVQTASRGLARIDFDGANRLQLGPSTLVIMREMVQEADRPARQASVLMLEGELWADVASGTQGHTMTLQVRTPSGVARVAPSQDAAARLKVSVNRERASTFAVYAGEATVRTQKASIRVGANQAVAVDSAGQASAPRTLPPPPALLTPADGAHLSHRDQVPVVTFSWRQKPGATGYRFLLARDAAFRKIVADVPTTQAMHREQGLPDGSYFWKVSAVAEGVEGAPAAARALHVERSTSGPRLSVQLPPPVVQGKRFVLEGTVSPSTRVWVSGDPVTVDDTGRFEHEIVLSPGMNVVVIEAVGTDGSTAYQSAIVNAKP